MQLQKTLASILNSFGGIELTHRLINWTSIVVMGIILPMKNTLYRSLSRFQATFVLVYSSFINHYLFQSERPKPITSNYFTAVFAFCWRACLDR